MPSPKTPPYISFTVYRNYLRAIRYILARHYGSGADQLAALADAVHERPTYQRIRQRTHGRTERLASLLDIAWQTEVALNLPSLIQDDELSAISIQWGTIQLYYAVYNAAAAWLEAMQGPTAPKTNRTVLRTLADFASTRALFPLPWGTACRSCTPVSFCGELAGYEPDTVKPVRSPTLDDAVDFLCLALKSVRKRELDRRVADWKRANARRRIHTAERAELDDFEPMTVFDFLWMLRVRATYVDAEFFGLGTKYQDEAVNFHECLCRIGAASLLLFEMLLVAAYGKAHVLRVAEAFLERSTHGPSTLGRRVDLW